MTDKVPESELADALAFAANIVNNTTVFTELIRKEEEETAKLSFAEIDQFYSLKAYAELLISEINNLMAARIDSWPIGENRGPINYLNGSASIK